MTEPTASPDVTELIERLRYFGNITYESSLFTDKTICDQAADALLALRQEVERLTRERDEARELAQLFSQADRKPDWIARAETAETAETALRLSTQRREDVVRALELLVASVGAVIVELKPGQSLSPAGAGRTNAMISDLNAARRALQPKEN